MMNQSNPFRHLVVAAFACLMAASCSDGTDDGTTLPDGKYPMTFTASVGGLTATRATPDNSWAGGEEVAIQIGSEVKKYTAANDGSLTITENGTPFYWQTTSDITVNAWYPYSTTKPTVAELRVKANQSEGNNYQSSDYLEAVDATVTFNTPAALIFKHRTAKVVVTLKAGEGVTDVANAAVTFVNQTGVDGGGTEVTPKTETIAGVTTYTALVIPQQMQSKKFIKVIIGADGAARDYYYTPTGNTDANLEAGHQYNYTITVKKTGLDVTLTSNDTSWTDESITGTSDTNVTYQITAPTTGVTIEKTEDTATLTNNGSGSYTLSDGNAITVTVDASSQSSKFLKGLPAKGIYDITSGNYASGSYTYTYILKSDLSFSDPVFVDKTPPALGDFYYFDGTWSADLWDKPCIGIVFKAGTGNGDALNNYQDSGLTEQINGYAVAVQDAARFGIKWSTVQENCQTSTATDDYKGYDNTAKVLCING